MQRAAPNPTQEQLQRETFYTERNCENLHQAGFITTTDAPQLQGHLSISAIRSILRKNSKGALFWCHPMPLTSH